MRRPRKLKHIEGLGKVHGALGHISTLPPVKLTQSLNKGAALVESRAKLLAPIADGRGGGDLRDSIDRSLTVDRLPQGGSAIRSTVFAGKFYAIFQEFGVQPHSLTKNASVDRGLRQDGPGHPGHSAQPFMLPAYYSVRKRVTGGVKRALNAMGKEIARRNRGG